MTDCEEQAAAVLSGDDNDHVRDTLKAILEIDGYSVATAADGLEALDYLRQNPLPRLILLDLMMPFMDGWEFRKEQQQDPRLAGIPVVVVTAADNPAQKASAVGAVDYCVKPVSASVLLDTVARYL